MDQGEGKPEWEERMLGLVARMRQFTDPFITYIAGDGGELGYRLVGSGVYVELGGGVFLLTVEHVSRERKTSEFDDLYYFIGSGRKMENIHHTIYESLEPMDLAMFRVDTAPFDSSDLRPITLAQFADSSEIGPNELLFLNGFPRKGSYATAFTGELSFQAESQPYGCFLGEACGEQFNPRHNFAITYPMMVPIAREDGKVYSLPMAEGISGSAVWRVNQTGRGEEWSPDRARLIGIAYRQDLAKHSILVTRVEDVRQFISEVSRSENISISGCL